MTRDQVRDERARFDDGFVPLIVTAELPEDLSAWANALRREHYPPDRNRVDAHVTLFRALPPSCAGEACELLAAAARDHAPVPARLTGVMSLGRGTALGIDSPAMLVLRRELADRLHGLLTEQDAHDPRLHVTVQNRVSSKHARALQQRLTNEVIPCDFRFAGFALHRYHGGPWELLKRWSFRG